MRKLRVKRNSNEKKLKRRRNIFCFFAVIYIALLLYFLFFSEHYGRNIRSESYRYNLKPFEEIGRFIKYRNAFTLEFFLVNMVGNVVAFMPFGFFLPIISGKFEKFYLAIFLTAFFSLMIESLQLATRVGSFDVDDIILNTTGGLLGYIIFKLCRGAFRKPAKKKMKKRNVRQQ